MLHGALDPASLLYRLAKLRILLFFVPFVALETFGGFYERTFTIVRSGVPFDHSRMENPSIHPSRVSDCA